MHKNYHPSVKVSDSLPSGSSPGKPEIELLLAQLVGYRTVAGNPREMALALNFIGDYLASRGFLVRRLVHDSLESLIASTNRTGLTTPQLCLAGHLDVVPGPDRLFRLTENEHALYGLGVFDMKFAIAAYMRVADRIKEHLDRYNLAIHVTTDEEIGGKHGTAAVLARGFRPAFTVLPDPGAQREWNVEASARGFLHIRVQSSGIAAHGSRPWEGKNAIDTLTGFLASVKESCFMDQGPRTSTLNVGRIAGGQATNQVPDSAFADLDMRFVSDAEKAHVIRRMQALAREYGVAINPPTSSGAAHYIDLDTPMAQALLSSVTVVTGRTIATIHNYGATDARFFDEHHLQCLVLGLPGGGHHSDGEWIDRLALRQLDEVLWRYVDTVASRHLPDSS